MAAEGIVDKVPRLGGDSVERIGHMSVPRTANIVVNRDNVLAAIKIVHDVLEHEGRSIADQLANLQVITPGIDPASVYWAQQWSARILTDPDSFAVRVRQYLRTLRTLLNNLEVAARNYGYTDDAIAAALGGGAGG